MISLYRFVFILSMCLLTSRAEALLDPNYLAETAPEVLWTLPDEPDLLQKASELKTPAAIYEYAHNEFEFFAYHGARSSSVNAFLGKRGNDLDQASALIAMFRSQGIPARYAVGLVRIPAEDAMNWLGVSDIDLAGSILDDQGIQNVAVAGDGSYLEKEHIWVQALVAQDQYRGAGDAATGDCSLEPPECMWLDLDPSFKLHERRDPNDILDIRNDVTFDYTAYYNARNPSFVPADGIERRDKGPLEIYEEQILGYLQQNHPGKTLEDVSVHAPIQQIQHGILPASLPYSVVEGTVQTFASVAEHDATETPKWSKTVVMDIIWDPSINFADSPPVSLAELSTKRLTYIYELGDPERMVARLGGEEFWVPLTAGSLTIGGEEVGIGFEFDLVIKMDGPPATDPNDADEILEVTYPNLQVGGQYLIAAGGETSNWSQVHRASKQLLQANQQYPTLTDANGVLRVDEDGNGSIDPNDRALLSHFEAQDALTGGVLWVAQSLYYARLRDATKRLGDLNHAITPISGFLGVISTVHEVESVAGTAFSILPGGLLIDMKGIKINGNWHIDAPADYDNDQFELLGAVGSALEHEIWQELTGYDALSTMSGIQTAVGNGATLINPKKTASENTIAAMYGPMGLASSPPSYFTDRTNSMFGLSIRTWQTSGGEHQFRVMKKVIDNNTPSLQQQRWTLTWDDHVGDCTVPGDCDIEGLFQFYDDLEDLLISIIPNPINPYSPCAGQGPFTDSTQALAGLEVCFWQDIANSNLEDYVNFFDLNQNFSDSDHTYRKFPRTTTDELNQYSFPFIQTIRNETALIYDQTSGEQRVEYVLGSRKPQGSFFRFLVYLRKVLVNEEIGVLSFKIANDLFGAAGGYVNGEEALLLSDGAVFNNEVLNDKTLSALTNNDLLRTPSTADPISTVTGNMYLDETDFSIKGRGLNIAFTRTYNSGPTEAGATGLPMGHGWTHSYNMRLVANDFGQTPNTDTNDGVVSSLGYVDERAGEVLFGVSGVGAMASWSVTNPRGVFNTLDLSQAGSQVYILRFRNGVEYEFGDADLSVPGNHAKLKVIRDPYGNELLFSYTGNQLTGIDDNLAIPARTGLVLGYHPSGHLATITDWTGRVWSYGYDADGNLTSYTNPTSKTFTYEYTPGTHHLIVSVKPADRNGDLIPGDVRNEFSYYENGKAFENKNSLGQGETVDYDLFRKRTRITDPRGFIRTHFYDGDGQLTKMIEPDGGNLFFSHTTEGLRNEKVDGLGFKTQYSYCAARTLNGCSTDTGGNVSLEVDPLGDTVETDYGAHDQITRIQDRNGNEILLEYYASNDPNVGAVAGKLAKQKVVSLDGSPTPITLTEFIYYPDGNLHQTIEFIDANDPNRTRITENFYSDDGLNLTRIETSGSGQTIVNDFNYDDLGRRLSGALHRRVSPDDPNTILITTEFTYTDLDQPSITKDPLGNWFIQVYDENKLPERTIHRFFDPNTGSFEPAQTVVTNIYDEVDRLVETIDLLGNRTRFIYDESGNLIARTDANGHTTRFEYDALNRRVTTIDANGHRNKTVYDLNGRVVKTINANGNATHFEYDAVGLQTKIINALGFETEFKYDNNGNRTHRIDANATAGTNPLNAFGATEYREYDELNRLTRIVDAVGGETLFSYDLLGNRTSITDAIGQVTRFLYDDLGRLIQVQDPRIETPTDLVTSFEYDEAGNLIRSQDRRGNEFKNRYDALNRLIDHHLVDDSEHQTYVYNHFGDLIQEANNEVAYTMTYDPLHRLTSQTDDRLGRSLSYSYDAVRNVLTKIDYQNDLTHFQYDSTNRLVAMRNAEYVQVSYHYDPAGRLLNRILSNGAQTNYAYDAANRLTLLENKTTNGSTLSHTQYSYDRVGSITSTVDASGINSYFYDALNRIIAASYPGLYGESFSYDPVGNRITTFEDGQNRAFKYETGNRLTLIRSGTDPNSGPVITSLEYDDNGNLINKRDAAGSVTHDFIWDTKNRLKSAATIGVGSVASKYDTRDYRIERDVAGTADLFHLESEHLEANYDSGGNLQSKYLRGVVVDEIVNGWVEGENLTYHHDHLQSVLGVSDHTGSTVESSKYRPYGRVFGASGASFNDLLFTGRQLDETSGLYYYRARYYDPELGRFINEDPLGFDAGINFYAYVENSPINFNDPMGKDIFGITVGGGGGTVINIPYLPPIPLAAGISATVAVDSNWDWNIVVTPEIGLGSPGFAGFVRGVYAPNDAAVVTDLEGFGLSVSPQIGLVSGSVSFPLDGISPQFDNPIVELGVGSPPGGASGTIGFGIRFGGSDASLNDPAVVGSGGPHCQCSQDPLSGFGPSSSSFDFGASGGFLLYPGKPNLNQMQRVYTK